MKIKTVKINVNDAPCIINETDFDPEHHTLWEGEEVTEVEEESSIDPGDDDEPNTVEVKHKGGGRWFVTVNGQSVHEGTLSKEDATELAAEY